MSGQRLWLATADAADRAERHTETILTALQTGELHGAQRVKGGRWRIHVDCLDAWVLGVACPHRQAGAA